MMRWCFSALPPRFDGVWVAPQNRKRGWGVTLNARKLTNCIGPRASRPRWLCVSV